MNMNGWMVDDAVAAKIPQQHLSKLMLQASFRKMLQDEHGPGQETLVEMDCLAIFGKRAFLSDSEYMHIKYPHHTPTVMANAYHAGT